MVTKAKQSPLDALLDELLSSGYRDWAQAIYIRVNPNRGPGPVEASEAPTAHPPQSTRQT